VLTIIPYSNLYANVWDNVVSRARSGNFLHFRPYMEYHAARYIDASVLVERNGKVVAVFPANLEGDSVISHGGLTYAGLISTEDLRAEDTLLVFAQLRDYYHSIGVIHLLYKAVPLVFQSYPAQEDLYALYRLGGQLCRRDVSSVIQLNNRVGYFKGKKWSINRAQKRGVEVCEQADLKQFYELLCLVLSKFLTKPIHSFDEIQLLKSRFPAQIILYQAVLGEDLLAGALVYDFGHVVHAQYLAASEAGKELGALDYLISHLIENVFHEKRFFSFGISTENSGKFLNSGLIAQKEGFGARAVVHDFYDLRF